ncbi:MAG TPA: helix-turn-helix domain-containing protein [Acidimicrobiales bacterium]|nr:helix-turn-helix domain-containing protein [Acidimicrobiales bacterium]
MPPRAPAEACGMALGLEPIRTPRTVVGKELVRPRFIIRLVLPVVAKEAVVADADLIDLTTTEPTRDRPLMKLLVTPEEAADLLSIGRSKLYELLAAGAVESVRVGTCRRIPVQALEDFVSRLRQAG